MPVPMHSDPPADAPPADAPPAEPDAEPDHADAYPEPDHADAEPEHVRADIHPHAHSHSELIMRHPVRWIIVFFLLLYVIKQPDHAAVMTSHLGTKLGQWSTQLGNSLGTFAAHLAV